MSHIAIAAITAAAAFALALLLTPPPGAAATASAAGTVPVGIPVFALRVGGNTGRICSRAYLHPQSVQVFSTSSPSSHRYDAATCPSQAVAEGVVIHFHDLHGQGGQRWTHSRGLDDGVVLYEGEIDDFRAALRNNR